MLGHLTTDDVQCLYRGLSIAEAMPKALRGMPSHELTITAIKYLCVKLQGLGSGGG